MNRRGFLSFIGTAPIAAPTLAVAAMAVQPKLTACAAEIYRDHARPGVPASGRHYPSKAAIRQWCAEIEAALDLKPANRRED